LFIRIWGYGLGMTTLYNGKIGCKNVALEKARTDVAREKEELRLYDETGASETGANYLCPFGTKVYFEGKAGDQLESLREIREKFNGSRCNIMRANELYLRRAYWNKFTECCPESEEVANLSAKWNSTNLLSGGFALYHPDGSIKFVGQKNAELFRNATRYNNSLGNGMFHLGNGDDELSFELFNEADPKWSLGVKHLDANSANGIREAYRGVIDKKRINTISRNLKKYLPGLWYLPHEGDKSTLLDQLGKIRVGNPSSDYVSAAFVGHGGKKEGFDLCLDGSLTDGVFVMKTDYCSSIGIYDYIRNKLFNNRSDDKHFSVSDVAFMFNECSGYASEDDEFIGIRDLPKDFVAKNILKFVDKKRSLGEEIDDDQAWRHFRSALNFMPNDFDHYLENGYVRTDGNCLSNVPFMSRVLDKDGEFSPGEIVNKAISMHRIEIDAQAMHYKCKLSAAHGDLINKVGREYAHKCLEDLLKR
jgi:hypothetical protein